MQFVSPPARKSDRTSGEPFGFLTARIWQGMPLSVWLPLLARNRFAISPSGMVQAIRVTAFGLFNSMLEPLDRLLFSRRVAQTELVKPPLFIIGHWRTGTTWLHELMGLNEQFTCPTTYQCMAPGHFLLSEKIFARLLAHMLPSRRPMDNMAVGFDRPQEDEFALCNLGVPSPYRKWMFPNHDSGCEHYLELEGLSPGELQRWAEALTGFVRRITYRDPRRVVLKSPTHTARVARLIEIFPGAQFIHIVRDPFVVFPSTVHTWKKLWTAMGFQTPHFRGLDEYVLNTFVRMYESFEKARPLLGEKQLVEVCYEDLIRDPVGELRRIYECLDLGDFGLVQPRLLQYQEQNRDYRTNRYDLSEELRRTVAERWHGYIRRYGYEDGSRQLPDDACVQTTNGQHKSQPPAMAQHTGQ